MGRATWGQAGDLTRSQPGPWSSESGLWTVRERDACVSTAPRGSSEAVPTARWDIHIWAFPSGPSTGLPGLLELPEQREEEESRGRPVTGLARKSVVSKHAVVTQIHVRTCLWDLESNQTKPIPGAPTAVGENSEPTLRPAFPPGLQ